MKYCCNKCGKIFVQKIDFSRHCNKKYPCITEEQLKIMIISENEDLAKLEGFFGKIRNILRDNESIIGKDALDVISDFLFLRLLKIVSNENDILNDIMEYEYDDERADDNKQYVDWKEIMKIVNKTKKDHDLKEKEKLLLISKAIFNIIFKLHPNTKDLFDGKLFQIKKSVTLMKMYEEFDKIDFENMDVDIKGKAYELTIQKEASISKEFGQFFTPRWVTRYMIEQLNPKVDKNGDFDNVMDPACGTAGFLTEYYKYIKTICNKEDKLIMKNGGKKLHGFEIVPKTRELALINVLLSTGSYNGDIIRPEDFIHMSNEYEKKKFKGNILTNPPFSMDKDYNNMFSDKINKIIPVKTKSGTFLFLQACTNIIEDEYKICMVSPNGKEIFGKAKDHVEIRKNVMEKCNLYKIVLLPSHTFKPYTSVETLILFMEKGSKTKEIKFVQLENNKDIITEKELVKVKYEKMKDKKYTWNYKDYYMEDPKKNVGTLKFEKFSDIFTLNKGKIQSSKTDTNIKYYGKLINKGDYDNWQSIDLKICDIDGENIFFSTAFNGNGKMQVRYYDGKCAWSDLMAHLMINDKWSKKISVKFYYYYFSSLKEYMETKFDKGSCNKSLNIDLINDFQIPIIPLEVQQKVVKELNAYYSSKEEIKKQLDNLPQVKKGTFEELLKKCDNIKKNTLDNILRFNDKKLKFKSSDGKREGKYNFYSCSDKIMKIDECEFVERQIIINRGGSPNIRIDSNFSISHDDIYVLKVINNSNNIEYIYYFLKSNIDKIAESFKGSGIKHINKSILENLTIKVPSEQDQEKIVEEMESYDKLEESLKEQDKKLDILIKKRFDHYIDMCKSDDDSDDDSDDSDSDASVEEKPKKKKKIVEEKPKKKNKPVEDKLVRKSKHKKVTESSSKDESDSSDEDSSSDSDDESVGKKTKK